MTKLAWDGVGERLFETGVDHGVLYIPNGSGVYDDGVAWNGLTTITEKPSGAAANPQFADNIKYLNLFSAEEFGATVEAFTFPDEFAVFDGSVTPSPGVVVGQQSRGVFGLCYRTKLGDDIDGEDRGFKLHLVYGCQASPSERAYTTVNDSPAALAFSWDITTTPVQVTDLKPTSLLTIDSTLVNSTDLTALLLILYGDVGVDPRLPLPDEVVALFATTATVVALVNNPTYNTGTHVATIVATTGITYYNADTDVALSTGAQPALTSGQHLSIEARPNAGYEIGAGNDTFWRFDY